MLHYSLTAVPRRHEHMSQQHFDVTTLLTHPLVMFLAPKIFLLASGPPILIHKTPLIFLTTLNPLILCPPTCLRLLTLQQHLHKPFLHFRTVIPLLRFLQCSPQVPQAIQDHLPTLLQHNNLKTPFMGFLPLLPLLPALQILPPVTLQVPPALLLLRLPLPRFPQARRSNPRRNHKKQALAALIPALVPPLQVLPLHTRRNQRRNVLPRNLEPLIRFFKISARPQQAIQLSRVLFSTLTPEEGKMPFLITLITW